MTGQELLNTFISKAETAGAQVFRVSKAEEIGPQLVEILKPLGSKIALVDTPSTIAANLETHLSQAGFTIEKKGAEFAREVDIGIVEFEYGIAETGTLAADATDLKSRLAAMLPLTCVALLPESNLKEDISEIIEIYASRDRWPGYLTLVTGPSRTADIERSLTIGVHGPERLIIILTGNGGEQNGR